jgi:hypothetical protein
MVNDDIHDRLPGEALLIFGDDDPLDQSGAFHAHTISVPLLLAE